MDNPEIKLYDFSKSLIVNESPMDAIALNKRVKEVAQEIKDSKAKYYCLLCRERNDYTIFNLKRDYEVSKLSSDLFVTLANRGSVIFIDNCEDNKTAYEIWIRGNSKEDNAAYYLFNYDEGIVEV